MSNAPTSAVIEHLLATLPDGAITVGDLIARLDTRAHGALLLVLALPMCVPNVPGISTIFGALMIVPATQLLRVRERFWLPAALSRLTFSTEGLARGLRPAVPVLRRVEVLIQPRLHALTTFPWTIAIGLQTLLMAFILVLPIPFANWPPSITVVMTALALLQRDGFLLLLTIPAALVSVLSVFLGGWLGWELLQRIKIWSQPLIAGLSGGSW